jgi:hypothetical protein
MVRKTHPTRQHSLSARARSTGPHGAFLLIIFRKLKTVFVS